MQCRITGTMTTDQFIHNVNHTSILNPKLKIHNPNDLTASVYLSNSLFVRWKPLAVINKTFGMRSKIS